jgi:hypothetical protein
VGRTMSITLNGTTGITTPDIDSAAAPDLDGSNFTNLPVSAPLFGTGETVTADKTLTSADDKKVFNCTSSVLLTLPTPAQGLVFGITASTSGNVSFAAASGSTKVGSYAGSALIEAGNSAIITCDGTNWAILGGSGKITIKVVQFEESGTYTPNGPVAFLACATGSTSSSLYGVNWRKGGSGGGGYSEKFFSGSLASSYSVVVGGAGPKTGSYDTSSARLGGTTTFDTISIPSSAVPVGASSSDFSASAGGVGSGGDFNATGGTGSTVNSDDYGSSGGGAATRAGNGGNAGTTNSSGSGSGGGTGGNNGVDGNGAGGSAATSEASGVHDITLLSNPVFEAGEDSATGYGAGGDGATSRTVYTDTVSGDTFEIGHVSAGFGVGNERRSQYGGKAGRRGHVTIVEFYA